MASRTGEEMALLRNMIDERNKKIQEMELQVLFIDSKLLLRQHLLEQTKMEISNDRVNASNTAMDFARRRRAIKDKIKRLYIDIRAQNGSLHEYAECLKGDVPRAIGSSYIVRIQAQLCKAMHSMGVLQHQLSIIKHSSNEVVQHFKDALNDMLEQKSRIEVDLLNELMVVDAEKRKIEEELKGKRERLTKESRWEQQDPEATCDSGGNRINGETVRELLKETVQERRKDGEGLIRENGKQQGRIQELEEEIKKLNEKLHVV